MSIDRQYGFVVVECDECGETYMANKGDEFAKVWAEARDEGWQCRKVGDDWQHYCGSPCEPGEGA